VVCTFRSMTRDLSAEYGTIGHMTQSHNYRRYGWYVFFQLLLVEYDLFSLSIQHTASIYSCGPQPLSG